jgi:hypothetical protein
MTSVGDGLDSNPERVDVENRAKPKLRNFGIKEFNIKK